ncbi:hypothetical protein PoB_004797700 [Plakobranchus ocellatus]|uniref:Uncharacterized protein n=1 Tax=Plakobranchus ocellatus TaxID=259542 RepID=A0AAV4BQ29_9GAST|nr:hypothetical protein PoB_004797700 [Plakobranchus ocellatus]
MKLDFHWPAVAYFYNSLARPFESQNVDGGNSISTRNIEIVGRTVAHSVGQMIEVRIPVRDNQFFIAPPCPALNGQLSLLRPGESKCGEECNSKVPHNVVCQEQSAPTPGFSMV